MKICHACRKELSIEQKVGRRDECPFCGADLHCCFNCVFYDAAAPKQCKEPIAELVKSKDRANFCDHFVFIEGTAADGGNDGLEKARKALDDLFRT